MDRQFANKIGPWMMKFEKIENEHLKAGMRFLGAADEAMFCTHLLIIGAVKRAVSFNSAFRSLVADCNYMTAAAILRMHMDASIRLYALWLVDEPEELAKQQVEGVRLSLIKDRDGNNLRDGHLVAELNKTVPWVQRVYNKASGFVHFSNASSHAAVTGHCDETRTVNFRISASDDHIDWKLWNEMLAAFDASCSLFSEVIRMLDHEQKSPA